MCLDAVTLANHVDTIVFCTGDGDFSVERVSGAFARLSSEFTRISPVRVAFPIFSVTHRLGRFETVR